MKLGFVIPFVGPAISSAAGLSAFCRGLEDLGYDTLWVGDRLVTPVDMHSTYPGKESLSITVSTEVAPAGSGSATSIKLIGGVEVAGALGLILPWLTGIAPILTPAAAVGLALLQVGAAVFHGRRAEYSKWPVNAVFLALAIFIAAARTAEVGR